MLRPEVMSCTKSDREGDRTKWCRRVPGNDAIERDLSWSEQPRVVEAHLSQCTCKDQVEPASAVDEYSSKLGALDDWIEY